MSSPAARWWSRRRPDDRHPHLWRERQLAPPDNTHAPLAEIKRNVSDEFEPAFSFVAASEGWTSGGPELALAEVAESLARTASVLKEMCPDGWMDAEGAATHLRRTPKAFEKVIAKGEIPRHYLTERGIPFSRKELDEWLMGR